MLKDTSPGLCFYRASARLGSYKNSPASPSGSKEEEKDSSASLNLRGEWTVDEPMMIL
jgi:hypothetical protein